MKFGVPWSAKGIKPQARETAKEAARRSGMSVDDWVNSVILQQAAQMGVQPYAVGHAGATTQGHELAGVNQRLDDLTRRIDQFTRSGAAAYAPRNAYPQSAPRPAPGAPPLGLDRAVAEIAARQRALRGDPSPARLQMATAAAATVPTSHLPFRASPPTQDLSGLEDQLRKITDQIETLRKPGVEEAINALRGELGDIGRALNEAMPKRAIDTIEKQIAGLTQRIAEGRQAGADGGALAGIEHGLSEVRDALRGLTPAEHLVGFNDAVAELAHKIDLIVAQKDPQTLAQLDSAITTLRGMANHVASNDAVSHLAGEVQALADKVDQLSHAQAGDALNGLEQRIEALAQALAERQQSGGSVPPRLESLVQSLTDKIEQIQQSRGDNIAVGHLEDRIVQLVERLDASDSRLTHLEAIERGLAELLVHIEDIRNAKAAGGSVDRSPAVDVLKHDIARTQDALDAVHGTLGLVVDRLATIERQVRGERPAVPAPSDDEPLELTQPVTLGVRAVSEAPMPEPAPPAKLPPAAQLPLAPAPPPPPSPPAPPPQAAPKRMPGPPRPPIDPDLPPDEPLEPGSGPPHMRANPAARIAASEAALGGAHPAAQPSGASNFIAAARRAAQAAIQQETPPRVAREAEEDEAEAPSGSVRSKMMRRVKSLFVAAGVIALVVGSIQIIGSTLDLGGAARKTAERLHTTHKEAAAPAPALVVKSPAPTAGSSAPINLLAPPPSAPSPAPANGSALLTPPLLSPPMLSVPEVTGSIPSPARGNRSAPASSATQTELPAAIGSLRLRHAAIGGDAAAAYEVAVRFAEGHGVPADLQQAARWYERAAGKGLALAQFRYASMLEKGQGVKKDLGQARRFYLAAAEQGNAKAMHNLAVLYAEGIDGKPDYATAVKWFEKAARHGVADSQYNLGILYARGIGVTKNLPESYKWFALAANRGDKESAKKRDEIGTHLNAEEMAGARRAVDSFTPAPQPDVATLVPKPPGGWDRVGDAPAAPSPSPAAPRRPAGPLSLGAFTVGNR